jgi:hypothetical protein
MSSGKRWDANPAEANNPLPSSSRLSDESLEFQNDTALPNLVEAYFNRDPQTTYNEENRNDDTMFNLLRAIEGTDIATHLEGPAILDVKKSVVTGVADGPPLGQTEAPVFAPPEQRPLPTEVLSVASQPAKQQIQQVERQTFTQVPAPQYVPDGTEIPVLAPPEQRPLPTEVLSVASQPAEQQIQQKARQTFTQAPAPQSIPDAPKSTQDIGPPIHPQEAEPAPGVPFVGLKKAIDRIGPQVRTATEALLDRAEKELSTWVWSVLSPYKRRSTRLLKPPLAAYYWTGDQPEPRVIANISTSGLYFLTKERWYPGTRVSMTLQRTDLDGEARKEWISVDVRIVRSGVDGVGGAFQFSGSGPYGFASSENCADKKTMERFVKRLMVNATA